MVSRIGKLPITVLTDAEVKTEDQNFPAKGAKGPDPYAAPEGIIAAVEGNEIILTAADGLRPTRARHGLTRSIMAGMIKGIHDGYSKALETVGTGHRAAAKGQGIEFFLGYPRTITVNPSEGIILKMTDANRVIVGGTDKQVVGQIAANIRKPRVLEPHKGKDIKYPDEHILHKAGEAGK